MSFSRGIVSAVASAVIAALPVVAPAIAGDPAIRIVYNDLNLATPAGIDQLYSRIRQAAAHYCGPEHLTGTRINSVYERCLKETIATTVQRVNVKALSTLHADHSGSAGQS